MKLELSQRQIDLIKAVGNPDVRQVFASGAVRSGKSFSLDIAWLVWTQGSFAEPQDFILAGNSVGSVKRNILPDMNGIADQLGLAWKFVHSGTYVQCGIHKYHLFGASDTDSVDNVRGMTAAGAYLDEMVLMDPSFISMVITRLSVNGAKLIGSMNPDSPGHFVKTDYIDKCNIGDDSKVHIKFGLKDNPSLTEDYITMLKSTLTGADYERLFEGNWVANSGVIYPTITWNDNPHGVHRGNPLVSCVMIDYSTSGTIAMLLGQKYAHGRTIITDEYYHSATVMHDTGNLLSSDQKTDEEIVDDLEIFMASNNVQKNKTFILPDPSAASFKRTLRQRGFDVRLGNNDILEGIRVTNTALALKYITIDAKCKILRNELETYIWDIKACAIGVDKPLKGAKHHGVDALRYYALKTYSYLTQTNTVIKKPRGM